MIDLDDHAALAAADPSDMLGEVERTAERWADAITAARAIGDLPTRHGITSVVYAGMGGSGIAGDAVAALATRSASLPITVVKGHRMPAWVGPNTLVICSSYSGNTRETVAAFEEAHARRARMVVLSAGGALAERADELGVARVRLGPALAPRAAFATLLVPTLVIMERLCILPDLGSDLADAEGVLAGRATAFGRSVPAPENVAKDMAGRLYGMIPVIWGQQGLLEAAATRWRCQLNENAKVPAFSAVMPELAHNEIEGYAPGVDVQERLAIVVLRGPNEHPDVTKQIEVASALARTRVGAVLEATAVGETPLARLMSIVLLGDLASVYLGLLRGVDPTPTPTLTGIKERLA